MQTELKPFIEGKTKLVFDMEGDPTRATIKSKNDITAGDGAKHDILTGKAEWATTTTCNVFNLLKECGIPVAFEKQVSPTEFMCEKCSMLPYEVIVRREAHGSYLKRAPQLEKGHLFPKLKLEYFLKTSDRKWKGYDLPCDDPFMVYSPENHVITLYHPQGPNLAQQPAQSVLTLHENEVFTQQNEPGLLVEMGEIARRAFLALEKAWQLQNGRLVDYKVEFGLNADGKLRLADVIDSDSWRVVDLGGKYMDKQLYRDGAKLDEVAAKFRYVAAITENFKIPAQRIVLWRGSDKDSVEEFTKAISIMAPTLTAAQLITCSVHKQPAQAYRLLQKSVQEVPDSVFIVIIGMSNGGGPTLSANTTNPVITVPATYKQFPDDVWSSLRGPSLVPVMTVLEPANAVLAALRILSARNPAIYSSLRYNLEKTLTDM